MLDDPSAEVVAVLRDQAFIEIERVANLAASYARSTGEAAFRGDQTSVLVHMRQVRLCCVSMIQTYKDYLEAERDGQGVAEAGGPSHAHRADQRSGDVVA
jgi:hypothetical protein